MNGIQMLESVVRDINSLTLQGVQNWNTANTALSKIIAVIDGMKKEAEAREKAYNAAIEDAKQRREKQLEEAKANGVEIVGGETIRINSDGSQEVLIP